MTVLAHDPPVAVAGLVAAESAWVPGWQRVAATGSLMALAPLLALGRLETAAAAVVAVGVALGTRLVPALAARPLYRDAHRVAIRRARERCLTAYAVAGLLLAGTLTRTGGDRWAAATALTAAVLTVLQHRPPLARPTLAVGAEVLESLLLLGILPLLAMATRGWWQ